jgi:predicted RNase H-like nuclease
MPDHPQLADDSRLTPEPTGRVVGVDGCVGGWFAVWADGSDGDGLQHALYKGLRGLFADHSEADRLLVDIPIGFESSTARECDRLARQRLGSRGVSVFPAPCRAVVEYRQQAGEAASYDRANEIQREHLDAGISQQAWNITDKIAAMDRYLREESPPADVYESHPELCFARLNRGYPIAHPKSGAIGRAARFGVLDEWTENWESIYKDACEEYYFNQVARDDIVDALVLCAAGQQPLASVPAEPPVDDRGLPMRIVAPAVEPAWQPYTELAER